MLGIDSKNDSTTFQASGLFLAVCLCVYSVPLLTLAVRKRFRAPLTQSVLNGLKTVQNIQNFRCLPLDVYFEGISTTVTTEFYVTLLPALFWAGESKLASQLVCLMSLCVHIGNAAKDTFCAPRPIQTPGQTVQLVSNVSKGPQGALEYGFPSTHTLNSLCMSGYILHHSSVAGWISPDAATWFPVALVLWVMQIGFSRLYLGASPHTSFSVLSTLSSL